MNANAVLVCLKNREFLKSLVCFLGCVALLWSVFAFCITPRYKKVQVLRNDLTRLSMQLQRYVNFDKYQGRIIQQRERIVNALHSAAVDQLLTDRTEQGVFNAIGNLCGKADIRLFTINTAEAGAWRVNVKSTYHNMVVFVSLLERSFQICRFKITSSRNTAVHSAELIVRPIDVSSAAEAEGKDLFDMYAEIEAALKGIEARSNNDKSDFPQLKDPLFSSDDPPAEKEPA